MLSELVRCCKKNGENNNTLPLEASRVRVGLPRLGGEGEFSSRTFVNLDPLCAPSDSNSVQKRRKLFGSYLVLFAEVFSLLSYSFPLRNLLHNPTAASLLTEWPRGSLVRIFDHYEGSRCQLQS